MDLGFAVSGILLMVFAFGLHRGLPRGSKAGPALLFLSGATMALLAFETDPIRRTGPRSWHGFIHDAAFVVFAAALLLALSPCGGGCVVIPHGAATRVSRSRPPPSARLPRPAERGLLPVPRRGAGLDRRDRPQLRASVRPPA
jgi:hypothetical protein